MCGILGFWNFRGRPLSLPALQKLAHELQHRGPDDEGYYLWREGRQQANLGSLGLAHRRLAVLDPSPGGHQPMADGQGSVWTVFNGEIFNFRELRQELAGRGYRFRTETDTEVLIHAYGEWGIEAIARCNGMFALAIWDAELRRLFLVRDRMGVKPLYYYQDEGCLVFASELKPILHFPGFSASLERQGLAEYLAWQYIPSPRSIFRHTRKLRPAHLLTVNADGRVSEQAYWNPADFSVSAGDSKSDGEYVEELEDLLTSAVRYRMISDVPLGAFLSGGIDSTLIVSLMQKLSPAPIKTFAIGFDDPQFDESGQARQVSAQLKTEHTDHCLQSQEVAALLPATAACFDEPFADTAAIPTLALSALARQQVTVSLSGDGGDELFGGYDRYGSMLRLERLRGWPAVLRRPLELLRYLPWEAVQSRSFWLEPYASRADAYSRLMRMWPPEELRALAGLDFPALPGSELLNGEAEARQLSLLQALSLLDLKTYLADCMMTKLDRASMSVSLEGRTPYLDYRVVEFALRLPDGLKLRQGEQKYILKALLRKYGLQETAERAKQGFNMPVARWLRAGLLQLASDYLAPSYLRRQGLFDPPTVQRLMQEHSSGQRNRYPELYSLIIFQLWHERYCGQGRLQA